MSEEYKKNHSLTRRKAMPKNIVNSSLWAAAGDSIGWISELVNGKAGLERRIGSQRLSRPVAWSRIVGGRGGPKVALPAGTYSDDTQLRLAVSRSIRGNGFFDVENFAKIELTVWPSYALGGGVGTKTAAQNLAKRTVNWFNNFYSTGRQSYFTSGGNGAAMRIQPHVWSSCGSRSEDEILLDVLKDSLVTHGHPHGFCGAIFHAKTLLDILLYNKVPDIRDWKKYIESFSVIPDLIRMDSQLSSFWLAEWESNSQLSLSDSILKCQKEILYDLENINAILQENNEKTYRRILEITGCLTDKYRGSGIKTALVSAVLAHIYQHDNIESALVCAANEIDSDTDTIASMCGALLGAYSEQEVTWPLQDRDYLISESMRLANIERSNSQRSFEYPKIQSWIPPYKQNDAVGIVENNFALVGLGMLTNIDERYYEANNACWQWFKLPFGQTILVKRKSDSIREIHESQLPDFNPISKVTKSEVKKENDSKDEFLTKTNVIAKQGDLFGREADPKDWLDSITDVVINSNFDDVTLGRMLNECINKTQSVQMAVSFSAIIAKAKIVRQRKNKE
ncbi:ADP-ribosylglycohydrolase family protein [Citrobacter koseri]|uniref:ADP-ribosylglycohydrolase family protein n=1 Tax=Citrobacter koseri TaxID=545 RepID=UPI000E1AC70C|nr:ADP-ribosylglycohydrolase family protein [Citrobacter koseri]MBJ9304209.1 ADP-ribosylglycohydrolase family protein [Citrobacter koseri]MBJ9368361.1 ADP-ribosylglycohydrolase family protein [Citrobacter koseri]SUX91125.1 ADP-ribosyl-[dinitrogen reductase] hydrolase [Citrobacter koseri]HAT2782433.1 ADP-ribosylglycohydrolase family protein [Citrobacter koseri]